MPLDLWTRGRGRRWQCGGGGGGSSGGRAERGLESALDSAYAVQSVVIHSGSMQAAYGVQKGRDGCGPRFWRRRRSRGVQERLPTLTRTPL